MKEKNLTIQESKNLAIKKKKPKEIAIKSKNTALIKNEEKKEKSLIASTKRKSSITKSEVTQKKSSKSKVKTKSGSKKNVAKPSKETTAKTAKTKKSDSIAFALEYFDLPYRYNETLIKLLAQTPERLFVYWDIADKDRENYIKNFGENFFNETIPFLKVKNETKNYTFDVEINDFANSWYINISDDDCKYSVELFRKFKPNTNNATINSVQNNYIFIATSNDMFAPNKKVLSTIYPRTIAYRNIKTNITSYKQIDKPDTEFYNAFFNDEHNDMLTNNPSSR